VAVALDVAFALERVENSGHGGGGDRNRCRVGARILRGVVVADAEAPDPTSAADSCGLGHHELDVVTGADSDDRR
jgi:hypothetical protein